MAKISFTDISSLEALTNNAYEIIIPAIPGAAGLEKITSYTCKGFTIPGFSVQSLEVVIQSFKTYNAAGNVVYPGEFTVSFQELSDSPIRRAFQSWMNICGGSESGTVGGNKTDYAKNIILRQYNSQGEIATEIKMLASWPVRISDVSAESTQSPTPIQFDVTFHFDKYDLEGLEAR